MYRIFNLLRKGGSAVGEFSRQDQKFIDLYRQLNRQRQRKLAFGGLAAQDGLSLIYLNGSLSDFGILNETERRVLLSLS